MKLIKITNIFVISNVEPALSAHIMSRTNEIGESYAVETMVMIIPLSFKEVTNVIFTVHKKKRQDSWTPAELECNVT